MQLLVDAMEADARIGAVAPRIVEPDGSLDYSLRRFPRLRSSFAQALFLHRVFPEATWVDEVIRDPAAYERPHAVEWVSGACFAVRRTRARADRRSRRELLPLQRGHGHLRADLERGLRGALRAGGRRRARGRRVGAHARGCCRSSPRAGSATRRSTTRAGARSPSARASRSARRRTSSLARSAGCPARPSARARRGAAAAAGRT